MSSVLSLCLISVMGQEPEFRHLTTKDGLSSHYVYSILKDSEGFMWFGTGNGLDRYDGYTIITYRNIPGDSTSLSDNVVLSIAEYDPGRLLIGTARGGINIFNKATEEFFPFQKIPGDPTGLSHNQINDIHIDHEGNVWLGNNNGLYLFHPGAGKFDVFRQQCPSEENRCNQIRSLFRDSRGTLWIGTNSGLYRFDVSNEVFSPIDLDVVPEFDHPIVQVNSINEDQTGIIWIASNLGLFKYDNDRQELIGPPYIHLSPLTEDIEFVQLDGRDYAWISSHWGLYRYDFQTNNYISFFRDPGDDHTLANQATWDLLFDDNGLLWISTYTAGIDVLKLYPSPFHQVIINPWEQGYGFSSSASEFFEDANGNVWIGSHEAGLLKYDLKLNLISSIPFRFSDGTHHSGGRIKKILRDSDGLLWVCVANPKPSICIYDEEKEMFQLIDTSEMYKSWMFPARYVNDMMEDSRGNIWFGSHSGLGWLPGSTKKEYRILPVNHPEWSGTAIFDLHEDSSGLVWVASYTGLYSIKVQASDSLTFSRFPFCQEAGNQEIIPRSVFQVSGGTIWIGTDQGLFQLNQDSSMIYRAKNENALLRHNMINAITEDKAGNLWMATDKGLVRYNPGFGRTFGVKLFERFDGLPYEGSISAPLYQSRSGKIFVNAGYASQNGFYWFHPDSIQDNHHPPNVVITDFKVRNKPYPLDSNIVTVQRIDLKYYQNYFSFEFAALDFMNPSKNQYAYKMEGIDEEWIYSENRRYASYTGIPPGNYSFHVKASNNDGYWNDAGRRIRIHIQSPPWKTWWAYAGYAIIIIGLFILWRLYDLRRIRLRQQLEIEHIGAARLKELDRLKSRFFANISHEFRTPLMLVLGPLDKLIRKSRNDDDTRELTMMQRNAQRLQNLINELLDLSRLESGKMELHGSQENMVTLVRSYVQQFESLAKHKGIALEFHSERDDIPAWVDRGKIEKILFNLLGNAFKWTAEGGRIRVEVGRFTGLQVYRSAGLQVGRSTGRQVYRSAGPRERGVRMEVPEDLKTRRHEDSFNGVEIQISDTGVGIPPEKLPHIFDRFYQAGDDYTKDGEGTGIGLALTKELVELHGGTITVESVVSQGSTFKVFLPIGVDELKSKSKEQKSKIKNNFDIDPRQPTTDNQEPATCNVQPATDPEPETRNAEPLILIVEDNPDMRLYIRGILGKEYRIREAGDGRQGLDMALEQVPDLVLSDVMMPKMDGYQFCRELKQNENTSHIPVILLTARASTESKIEGLETGADDFITKPFDSMELMVRVKNLIDQRRRWREQFLKRFHRSDFNPFPQLLDSAITSLDEKFLQKAYQLVEQHIDDPEFTVEQFITEMAMSQVQLYRKLKALLNLSANEFIRSLRLNYAARLIGKKAGNIAQVSYAVGFNNPSYFAECFKKQFGMTPREFAKQ